MIAARGFLSKLLYGKNHRTRQGACSLHMRTAGLHHPPPRAFRATPSAAAPSSDVCAEPSASPLPPSRPLLLFDLNGTLVNTTDDRKRTGSVKVRPGVAHLKRLLPRFRLGVYSCASDRTVREAVRHIDTIVEDSIFTTHMDARACDVFPDRMEKPLRKHFGSRGLSNVLLIDDTPHKSAPGEHDNMIVVPTWYNTEDDDCLPVLVDAILDGANASDARVWRARVVRALRQHPTFDIHAR